MSWRAKAASASTAKHTPLKPGDVVVITPGERHKVWAVGAKDLVLLVTCVPAYSVEEVIFTE